MRDRQRKSKKYSSRSIQGERLLDTNSVMDSTKQKLTSNSDLTSLTRFTTASAKRLKNVNVGSNKIRGKKQRIEEKQDATI